jgi:phenylalanyl-tRNA synthetase alpha chain
MEAHTPPFQILVPGRVFRYEATDATHEINFWQYEGLMVGKDVSVANFKYVIETFFAKFFGKKVQFRYRPSYFPFTEPSWEVDIKFGDRWIEMMGAGMVHQNVFKNAGYAPGEWQGFAFGMGDRLAIIKYGIPDVRLSYSGDLRFINQF